MGVEVYLDEKVLYSLLKRRKPAKVFWCDMSDLFGKWVRREWIDKCFAVMALTPHLTHQILTKRTAEMAEYFSDKERLIQSIDAALYSVPGGKEKMNEWFYDALPDWTCATGWPLPNVWLGTSVEDQPRADERIPHLLRCPAAVRFLSCEPLLGEIELSHFHIGWRRCTECKEADDPSYERPLGQLIRGWAQEPQCYSCDATDSLVIDGHHLHWVIVGGESGHGARRCAVEWIRRIVAQCKAAGVACFVKQLGSVPQTSYYDALFRQEFEAKGKEWPEPIEWSYRDGQPPLGSIVRLPLADRKGGDMAEWSEDLRVREFPSVAVHA